MSSYNLSRSTKFMLLAGILASSIVVSSAKSQTATPSGTAATPNAGTTATPVAHPQPAYLSKHAVAYYASVWGIESPIVKYAESGEIIRFSWRVVDAEKAKPLNDKKVDPVLIDPQVGVKLVVPSMEKVGQLRQSSTPEAGKSYWMAFSNKGRLVKRGDRVDVVIGNFRAEGLIVQ